MIDDISQRIEESAIGKPVYVKADIYDTDLKIYVAREFNSTLLEKDDKTVTISTDENPYLRTILRKKISSFKGTPSVSGSDGQWIYIELHDGSRFKLTVYPGDSIENIKAKLQDVRGFLPDQQRLSYEGKQLEDGRTLSDYRIGNSSTVHVELTPG